MAKEIADRLQYCILSTNCFMVIYEILFNAGMDPAEKFWGGEVARSAAEGAMAGVRGRSPR